MLAEKRVAYSDAYIAGTRALWTEGSVDAISAMIEVYRRTVSANCSRLSPQS